MFNNISFLLFVIVYYLVDVSISLHVPSQGAGHGNSLAHMDLAVPGLPHAHLHGAVVGDVLADMQETLVGIIHHYLV